MEGAGKDDEDRRIALLISEMNARNSSVGVLPQQGEAPRHNGESSSVHMLRPLPSDIYVSLPLFSIAITEFPCIITSYGLRRRLSAQFCR